MTESVDAAPRRLTRVFFAFFLVSGFCSLLYQIVWLRLAMAQFGVNTPLVSSVLSVFMAGLGLGSWSAGILARRFAGAPAGTPLRLYGLAELIVALSASSVPLALEWGGRFLAAAGGGTAWGSAAHFWAAGLWLSLVLLPFCTCMGATLPLAMWAIERRAPAESRRSFSYLYLANVVGAALGTLVSAFVLIELLGFRGSLHLSAAFNALLAAGALVLSLRAPGEAPAGTRRPEAPRSPVGATDGRALLALFGTGLTSMAMEVVWVREFTPYLGNLVYAFAAILFVYLIATFAGSGLYRREFLGWGRGGMGAGAWGWVALLGLLPLVAADPRLPVEDTMGVALLRVVFGVAPFSAAVGFLTPMLVDHWSSGDPRRAGEAYAVNVLGCIVGPLLAGFVLLPWVGERWSLYLASLALYAVGAVIVFPRGTASRQPGHPAYVTALSLGLGVALLTRGHEERFPATEVRRDYAATVVATGQGWNRALLVNGIGMTYLTPITKLMVHLPLAQGTQPPRSGLIICFGMGTSFRSMLSWGISTTAVELVPSVPAFFGYFHEDGPALLKSPLAHVVIDDGRRFLERTTGSYDAIVIDPPPPVSAAGSSLLYSREFYSVARRRLAKGGILQQWTPGGDPLTDATFVQALREAFPHVRVFVSVEGVGLHCLASDQPIATLTAAQLAARLPPAAASDLVEWGPEPTQAAVFDRLLQREIPPDALLRGLGAVGGLRDDRPVNEYFLMRTVVLPWLANQRRAMPR